MRISHETIYQSLYVQGRGELRRQLARNLRTGRTKRKARGGGPERRGRIAEMVPIAQRPPEVDERRVPGHWEGDLLVGKQNRSYVATLVERHTRYVMLARLGSDRTTENVTRALKQRIAQLPDHLVVSLTWDQGNELSSHQRFRAETGVDVYFCDPHSPWQRGSNENTNGLLRQYMPKGSDLSLSSQKELDQMDARHPGRRRRAHPVAIASPGARAQAHARSPPTPTPTQPSHGPRRPGVRHGATARVATLPRRPRPLARPRRPPRA